MDLNFRSIVDFVATYSLYLRCRYVEGINCRSYSFLDVDYLYF